MSLMALKHYPEEFKADAVALYLSDPSKTYKQVAEDLGINRATLRQWVLDAQAKGTGTAGGAGPIGAGRRGRAGTGRAGSGHWPGGLSSPDVLEEENQRLRARIRELELEREILRKAAKFFAGETNW
jgi:transposase